MDFTVKGLAAGLAAKKLSSEELAKECLARVAARDGEVGAFLEIDEAHVLDAARASDARRAAGKPLSPYDGIPVGIKDCIAVKGERCSCASKLLEPVKSPFDSTAVARLKKAGFIPFGRLNMDEFAMGSSCENSAFHPTRNPLDLSRVPGGSSGGSAAAVAAEFVPAALGSDTGGSIRQPAAFCGITGVKPTYGRVSRSGLVAFASSLDQIGPMTRNVEDAAILLDAIAGHDPMDSTSLPDPAGGWFEWVRTDGGKKRIRFFREDGDAVFLGGLYIRGGKEPLPCLSVLTREAPEAIRFLHRRMPVLIPKEEADRWLDPSVPYEEALPADVPAIGFRAADAEEDERIV